MIKKVDPLSGKTRNGRQSCTGRVCHFLTDVTDVICRFIIVATSLKF